MFILNLIFISLLLFHSTNTLQLCVSSLFNKDSAEDTTLLIRKVNNTSILIAGSRTGTYHSPLNDDGSRTLIEWNSQEDVYSPYYPQAIYRDNGDLTHLFTYNNIHNPILDP